MFRVILTAIGMATLPVLANPSDDEIRQVLIQEFIAAHPICACPYSLNAEGKYCGAKSAWARPGAKPPACYAEDITPEMIAEVLARKDS